MQALLTRDRESSDAVKVVNRVSGREDVTIEEKCHWPHWASGFETYWRVTQDN